MQNEKITLYPSNWLYNAGVIGFLRVLESAGENVEDFLKDDGSVEIITEKSVDEIFSEWDKLTLEAKYSYKGQRDYYPNQGDGKSIKKRINFLVNGYTIGKSRRQITLSCTFCKERITVKQTKQTTKDFTVSQTFGKVLFSAERTFKNSYWNNESKDFICPKCQFIVMCHHIGLIPLFFVGSENKYPEIFINAPSFKIMWHLNKYARTLYEKQEVKEIKEILGISLIEMASRLQLQLSKWTKMNIEVIVKYKVKKDKKYEDKIDFFSLPYEVVDVLSDKEVSSLLNEIGEFKVLNMVLDGKFDEILKFGEKIFRIVLKPKNEWGKNERDFINENVKLERNKKNLILFSQTLFKLYALISDKIKKEVYL